MVVLAVILSLAVVVPTMRLFVGACRVVLQMAFVVVVVAVVVAIVVAIVVAVVVAVVVAIVVIRMSFVPFVG